jgi:hypothetical protein
MINMYIDCNSCNKEFNDLIEAHDEYDVMRMQKQKQEQKEYDESDMP